MNVKTDNVSLYDQHLKYIYEYLSMVELECNESVLSKPYPNDEKLYCNATFDGWACWNYTLAGTRAVGLCPKAIFPHETKGRPFKDCTASGLWWARPDSGRSWTNYTPCENIAAKERSLHVLNVYFSGYIISMVMLFLALGIFSYFKQLQNMRITIHKHLFLSYLLTSISWVVYYLFVALGPTTVLEENPIWCQALHVTTHYLTTSNYAWMFSEGYYLYCIIVLAYENEKRLSTITFFTGWISPVIPLGIYVSIRLFIRELGQRCWTDETYFSWIITGPIALSLLINFVFLVNIARILFTKLKKKRSSDSESFHSKRAVRVCLILIPLFGLHYLLMPVRPSNDETLLYIYDIVTAILISYQGALVSILFCFLNLEVSVLMKRKFRSIRQSIKSSFRRDSKFTDTLLVRTDRDLNAFLAHQRTRNRYNSDKFKIFIRQGSKEKELKVENLRILFNGKTLCSFNESSVHLHNNFRNSANSSSQSPCSIEDNSHEVCPSASEDSCRMCSYDCSEKNKQSNFENDMT